MTMDTKTIIGIAVVLLALYLAFKLVKALLPFIFIGAVAYFGWRWYRQR